MVSEQFYHETVLKSESVDALHIVAGGTYVDVTFGGGGHTREILTRLAGGRVIGFDQDPDAGNQIIDDDRFMLVPQNFRYLKNYLRQLNAWPALGILADLGVSSHQFDEAERGFSFRADAPLDMRMDQAGKLSAADVLNQYPVEKLTSIFKNYGELGSAAALAKTIDAERLQSPITTTGRLAEIAGAGVPEKYRSKHLAQVFQALRIEVNDELGALKDMLIQASESLATGGRLVVISYHSLEDRLVKHFMKFGNFEGEPQKDFFGNLIRPMKPVTNKVIVPNEAEIRRNNRARSAKLRIAEKI